MKKTLLFLVVSLMAFACGSPKRPALTSDVNFQLETEVESMGNRTVVKGSTNLPEGTKICVNARSLEGIIFAQNFEVFVEEGTFEAPFGVTMEETKSFELSCYANEHWQNEGILKQLKFIKSDNWNEDELAMAKIDVESLVEAKMHTIIGAEEGYEPVGTLEEVAEVPFGNVQRLRVNINYKEKPSDEVIAKELRHFAFEVWKKDKHAKAIALRCFRGEDGFAFKTATFAPEGDWTKAAEATTLDRFELRM